MHYVYLLRAINFPDKTYVGYTKDLNARLACHNAGGSVHTALYKPWQLVTYLCFIEEQKAKDFEKYLKFQSGRAFAQKRLW